MQTCTGRPNQKFALRPVTPVSAGDGETGRRGDGETGRRGDGVAGYTVTQGNLCVDNDAPPPKPGPPPPPAPPPPPPPPDPIPGRTALNGTVYPGSLMLSGENAAAIAITAELMFVDPNTTMQVFDLNRFGIDTVTGHF